MENTIKKSFLIIASVIFSNNLYCYELSLAEKQAMIEAQKRYGCTKLKSAKQHIAETSFMQNPIKYYKRWALAHCLKYTSSVDKTMSSGCGKKMPQDIINLRHIDNMTRLLGDEPLSELKTYIDEYYEVIVEFSHKGYVNACFDLVYENKEFDAEVERIIKKYCKECE